MNDIPFFIQNTEESRSTRIVDGNLMLATADNGGTPSRTTGQHENQRPVDQLSSEVHHGSFAFPGVF